MNVILVFFFTIVLATVPVAAEPKPAGYVVRLALAPADTTAIVRDGRELAPKLLMPLYNGDVVLVRDPESRVEIEVGEGGRIEIGGTRLRYVVTGEIATSDDAGAIFSAIAQILDGEKPGRMVANREKGNLKLAMAVPGPNFLVKGERELWLAWAGGKGPFKVILEIDGRTKVFTLIRDREFTLHIPDGDLKRFEIVIKDSGGKLSRSTIRFRDVLPALPSALARAAPGETTATLAHAAYLTTLHEGDWTMEAAQMLHHRGASDDASAELLDRIVRGWKFD